MELLLVRHAIAVPRRPGLPDPLRPLTPQGRQRFRRCVAGLERLGVGLDGLYHSPWQRAVETAVELADLGGEPTPSPLLAEDPGPALLALAAAHERVALVGHEPWMGEALALCLGARYLPVAFKKGGVAWLRGRPEPGGLELLAMLPPRVLVKLA